MFNVKSCVLENKAKLNTIKVLYCPATNWLPYRLTKAQRREGEGDEVLELRAHFNGFPGGCNWSSRVVTIWVITRIASGLVVKDLFSYIRSQSSIKTYSIITGFRIQLQGSAQMIYLHISRGTEWWEENEENKGRPSTHPSWFAVAPSAGSGWHGLGSLRSSASSCGWTAGLPTRQPHHHPPGR